MDKLDSRLFDLASDIKADAPEKKRKGPAGQKNHGITNKSRMQYRKEYAAEKTNFMYMPQPEEFTIEKVNGEIIAQDDLQAFQELYTLTCHDVLQQFKADNADLIKKPSYMWYKPLLVQIKRNVPAVGVEELEKLEIIWACLFDFLLDIGMHPTIQTFEYMTGIYKYKLEKMQDLRPGYADFLKRIYQESKSALIDELQHNPYSQTNKIFIAKSYYGLQEDKPVQHIEIHHDIRNIDNLPMFSNSDLKK